MSEEQTQEKVRRVRSSFTMAPEVFKAVQEYCKTNDKSVSQFLEAAATAFLTK